MVRAAIICLALAGCAPTLPRYPQTVEADGHLVECGKPYTRAEDEAGIEHDCRFYGKYQGTVAPPSRECVTAYRAGRLTYVDFQGVTHACGLRNAPKELQ